MQYMHEIECEYGEAISGVYRRKDIESAQLYGEWDYDDYGPGSIELPTTGPTYIGVDWDKYQGVGPQICIVQWDMSIHSASYGKLKVVYREEIEPNDFCLSQAVDRLIELNAHFNPRQIYLDPGLGEHQIEVLQRHGIKHPETGLAEKVVRFNFKAKDIVVIDTRTGEPVKKENKHWMINTSVMYFSEGRIAINPKDGLLIEQLEQYSVTVSPSGNYIYTDQNEHALDALNLATLAFDREYGERYDDGIQSDFNAERIAFVQNPVEVSKLHPTNPQLFDPDNIRTSTGDAEWLVSVITQEKSAGSHRRRGSLESPIRRSGSSSRVRRTY
jgi:hypothetical protein